MFCCLKFSKPCSSTFRRKIWKYDDGDFNRLRTLVSEFDWNSCFDPDINIYVDKFTTSLTDLCNQTIPNKIVTVRKSDPDWMHSSIRQSIRKRKRAYDKAKQTNSSQDWTTYKRIRNDTVSLIRSARVNHMDKLAEKLRSDSRSSSGF